MWVLRWHWKMHWCSHSIEKVRVKLPASDKAEGGMILGSQTEEWSQRCLLAVREGSRGSCGSRSSTEVMPDGSRGSTEPEPGSCTGWGDQHTPRPHVHHGCNRDDFGAWGTSAVRCTEPPHIPLLGVRLVWLGAASRNTQDSASCPRRHPALAKLRVMRPLTRTRASLLSCTCPTLHTCFWIWQPSKTGSGKWMFGGHFNHQWQWVCFSCNFLRWKSWTQRKTGFRPEETA